MSKLIAFRGLTAFLCRFGSIIIPQGRSVSPLTALDSAGGMPIQAARRHHSGPIPWDASCVDQAQHFMASYEGCGFGLLTPRRDPASKPTALIGKCKSVRDVLRPGRGGRDREGAHRAKLAEDFGEAMQETNIE